jgi:hypothetical protein
MVEKEIKTVEMKRKNLLQYHLDFVKNIFKTVKEQR